MSSYLDGVLAPEAQVRVQAHLEHCVTCRNWLQEATLIGEVLRTEFAQLTPSAQFEQGVWERIAWVRKDEQFAWLLWLGLGASLTLALLVVLGVLSPFGQVALGLVRLAMDFLGYAWMLGTHLLETQASVLSWVVVSGIALAGLAGFALRGLVKDAVGPLQSARYP